MSSSMEESRVSLLVAEDNSNEEIGPENSGSKQRDGGWRASSLILFTELFLNTAFLGISQNLVVYLKTQLLEDNAAAASHVSTWLGTCFLTTLIGAYVSDSYWGNFYTIMGFGILYLIGMVTLTLSESLEILKHSPFYTFLGLYLISVGYGATKPCLSTFGADQFDETNTEAKASFFSWYYISIKVAAIIASAGIVWIQENYGWTVGFMIPTFLGVVALMGFMAGSGCYRHRKPRGSPFTRLFQVIVAASRKTHLKLPEDISLLYQATGKSVIVDQDNKESEHTTGFSFLDKAAIVTTSDFCSGSVNPWSLCDTSQVEDLKSILRLLPIWATFILFAVVVGQEWSVFVEQGMVMDRRIGSSTIPAASLSMFNVLAVFVFTPIYDKVIRPIVSRFTRRQGGMTPLQRAGIGMIIITFAIASAAIVEVKRLQIARDEGLVHEKVAVPMSIFWQIPQHVLIGIAEVFNQIGLLEFFNDQAPDSLRSLCLALALLTLSLGSYLTSFILAAVNQFTRWIPENLNEGHLDHYFWMIAGLSLLNLAVFTCCSSRYRYRRKQ